MEMQIDLSTGFVGIKRNFQTQFHRATCALIHLTKGAGTSRIPCTVRCALFGDIDKWVPGGPNDKCDVRFCMQNTHESKVQIIET